MLLTVKHTTIDYLSMSCQKTRRERESLVDKDFLNHIKWDNI